MAGLNEILIDENALYFSGATVPQNTSATSTSVVRTGEVGQLGAIQIDVRAKTDVSLADTLTFTATVQDSADGLTGWADVVGCAATVTASGATTFSAGEVLAQTVLNDGVREYTRVVIATDDASATGTVDVYCNYLAR